MIGAVILAAGGSSRMGRAKQSLIFRGHTLLRRTVDAASNGGCDPVLVVLGAGAERLSRELRGLPVEVAINDLWTEGMASSIRCGVDAVVRDGQSVEAFLLLLCDQPHIGADVVRRVLAAFDGAPERCVACAYGGTVGPPALFGLAWLDELRRLEGDRGAKKLLTGAGARLVKVAWPEGTVEIDEPRDYDRLIESDPGSRPTS